jgi:hypothetical protein
VKNIKRIAAATALTTGLGLAGLGAASVAEAYPGPMPDYHWCPGQWWDPGWGQNWGGDRCHDDNYFDGEAHDRDHWRGPGEWHPDNGWGPGGDHDRGPGGPGWHDNNGWHH